MVARKVGIGALQPLAAGFTAGSDLAGTSGAGKPAVAPKPTPMISLAKDEVGWTAVIPELLGPR